jgi:hypothetical protein
VFTVRRFYKSFCVKGLMKMWCLYALKIHIEKIQVSSKPYKNNGKLHEYLYISRWIPLRMRNISDKVCGHAGCIPVWTYVLGRIPQQMAAPSEQIAHTHLKRRLKNWSSLWKDSLTPWRWHLEDEICRGNLLSTIKTAYKVLENLLDIFHMVRMCFDIKAIPLQALTGPEGSRRLRLPDFKTIGTRSW